MEVPRRRNIAATGDWCLQAATWSNISDLARRASNSFSPFVPIRTPTSVSVFPGSFSKHSLNWLLIQSHAILDAFLTYEGTIKSYSCGNCVVQNHEDDWIMKALMTASPCPKKSSSSDLQTLFPNEKLVMVSIAMTDHNWNVLSRLSWFCSNILRRLLITALIFA
ncbi:hypothetical protein OGATHE_005040 [Ogataea polymorpha]|uniref:Uncharacterized protein n=1 Tax=Ogataea polymorpha TaxID=460523 RepID=A0A9P8SZG6_9ASCO|nr:hypothetical protein OGATHE_005040 [Ogataea polymorpha]